MSRRLEMLVESLDYGVFLPAIGRLPGRLAYSMSNLRGDLRFRSRNLARKRGLDNLSDVFPEKHRKELETILRECFRTEARDEMETYYLTLPEARLRLMVRELGLEPIRTALGKGRGVLLYTGHMGNPAIFLTLLGRLGIGLNLIFRRVDNTPTKAGAWVRYGRMRIGRILAACRKPALYLGSASYFSMRRLLRSGEPLMMAIDVVPSLVNRFATVEFFGRPARFPSGPARIWLDTGAEVLLWSVQQVHTGLYDFVVENVTPKLSGSSTVTSVTQIMVAEFEKRLRTYPDSWYQWDALDQFFVSEPDRNGV